MTFGWREVVSTVAFAVGALLVVLIALVIALGDEWRHVEFAAPLWCLLAVVPLLAVVVQGMLWPAPASLRHSRRSDLLALGRGLAGHLAHLPNGLRLAAAILLCLSVARPQSTHLSDKIEHEGIDIALALDLSESMESRDVHPSRIEAAQAVIDDFIARRRHDRIAVVAFGAQASTVAPLTLDHDVLRVLVRNLKLGVIDGTRTAIGAGLGVALNRLDESEAETKVVVLLTDGVHNAGGVDPDTVAQEAAERDVRVYTVLMGRHGGSLGRGGVDAGQLERIASVTGGFAYTAQDREALQTSFQDLLDKLERSAIESNQVRAELFMWLLWPALLLLLLDVGLRNTRLRRFP